MKYSQPSKSSSKKYLVTVVLLFLFYSRKEGLTLPPWPKTYMCVVSCVLFHVAYQQMLDPTPHPLAGKLLVLFETVRVSKHAE